MATEARLDAWLSVLHERGGSDILLSDGSAPVMRLHGALAAIEGADPLTGEEIEAIMRAQIDDHYGERVHLGREIEFSFTWRNRSRVRTTIFYQRNTCSATLHPIPLRIPTLGELGVPPEMGDLIVGRPGLVLVTGQAGSGKSTTMAAMIDQINRTEQSHIIAIEDPIEFVHANRLSVVSQREVGTDTRSFATGLSTVLRGSPDVVVVSDIRDAETISAVLAIAETGHRVIGGMSINDSVSCIDRLIEVFPAGAREQVRVQLAGTLLAVLYQRLLPTRDESLVPAFELLVGVPAIRRLIRDGATAHLREAFAAQDTAGMRTLETSLSELVADGRIDLQTAVEASLYPQDVYTAPAAVRA
ncbi:MAG TPA: PilT/PilU family type 4a pilus ATPase [Acidimicrobiales bacterium]|nr:PilT/PilU family type 4a pilus ATPase [Acidimicrobiales bacterium]